MAAETSRMKLQIFCLVMSLLAFASCKAPPQSAYDNETSPAGTSAGMSVGQNTAGESCNAQKNSTGLDIYCGTWDQPSAHVQAGDPTSTNDLLTLATTSPWRVSLEGAYACNEPVPGSVLDGIPAEVLSCTQRFGGWPHVAFVAVISGRAYFADGVAPALPPLQRAVGVLSGKIAASDAGTATVAASNQVLAQRLAAQAFSSGDISHYEALMSLGSKANQGEDFPSAVIAYRAALALQQKKLGSDNPGTVAPMLELALNLSNEAQYPEARALFGQAASRAALSSDPTAPAKLLHYEGLDQLNQNHDAAALTDLDRAAAAYSALLPPDVLAASSGTGSDAGIFSIHAQSESAGLTADQVTLNSPVTETALLGIIEVERYRAIALRALNRGAASDAALLTADRIAAANDIEPPILDARLSRTGATVAMDDGKNSVAIADLTNATAQFMAALPGSLPVAETELLQAPELRAEHRDDAALASCRNGIGLLKNLQLGTSAALISPCLDVFADAAQHDATKADGLHDEMFEAAELAQGSVTSQQIAAAAARLASSSSNPKAAAAIRTQQDAAKALAALYQQRDQFTHAGADAQASSGPAAPGLTLAALDKQIAAATTTLSQADLAVQAAAPNFGQLVQQVVPASAVLSLLRPDEGFLGITSAPDHTWLFLLHGRDVDVARSDTGETAMTSLVAAIKASIEPTQRGLPPFDMQDARTVYQATLAPFQNAMAGVHELVVAPSGPLLALPFGLLPVKQASDDDLINAPWLIRQTTLAYVPAAANFVSLRKISATSAATKPWFGFGDFQPVTLAQAQATYSTSSCQDSAQLFANLPNLPYAKLELQAAEATFGGTASDELLGADFTVPNVEKADLKDFRILHFATHALLPTDLPCQNEPAIVTSAPAGAKSADQALLNTGDVANLHLDANLVILSACNTGGGAEGGEALSGLARSFFYAGARALMVTQWSVNDQVSAYLVADTLSRLHGGAAGGAAGSLQSAQLALIQGAGHGFPAEVANPFFWAAFSVIGDGGNPAQTQLSALSGTANAGL